MRIIQISCISILIALSLLACQAESAAPATPYPTYTPYPTLTPWPTYTPYPPAPVATAGAAQIWPHGNRDDVIPYQDAAAFIGETVTVEGRVVDTHNSDKAIFLNFDNQFDSFTAVIFPADWPKFVVSPEQLFYGKLVRVEGLIEEYDGQPEIIIRDPWQIEVALTHGQPVRVAACDCPTVITPTTEATTTAVAITTAEATSTLPPAATEENLPADIPAIAWEQAADYMGQTVRVTGQVIRTYNSGRVVYLNFVQQYQGTFTVVLFPEVWPLFPSAPEDYFAEQRIMVTGQLESYKGTPQIIVDDPNQIERIE